MSLVRLEDRRVDTPAFTNHNVSADRAPVKWCIRCRKTIPLNRDYWYKDASSDDGWMGHCKACHKRPSPNGRYFNGVHAAKLRALGSHGVTVRAGHGVVSAPAPVTRIAPVPPAAPAENPAPAAPVRPYDPRKETKEERPVEREGEQTVELVDASRSFMGKTTLGEYMSLEEAPSVWVGPAGVSVMATRGQAGVEYSVVTPFGDAPSFATTRDAAHYIVGLLVDKHALSSGAALEGVMLVAGSRRP
jgi:hypothetical protein